MPFAALGLLFCLTILFPWILIGLNLLGFSPSGRFAKNVKGRPLFAFMEKVNDHRQKLDLVSRLLQLVEPRCISRSLQPSSERVTQPATRQQLLLLKSLGIRPKWVATRQEADEMIENYRIILDSAGRRSYRDL